MHVSGHLAAQRYANSRPDSGPKDPKWNGHMTAGAVTGVLTLPAVVGGFIVGGPIGAFAAWAGMASLMGYQLMEGEDQMSREYAEDQKNAEKEESENKE